MVSMVGKHCSAALLFSALYSLQWQHITVNMFHSRDRAGSLEIEYCRHYGAESVNIRISDIPETNIASGYSRVYRDILVLDIPDCGKKINSGLRAGTTLEKPVWDQQRNVSQPDMVTNLSILRRVQ